jgi:hypothetical protein
LATRSSSCVPPGGTLIGVGASSTAFAVGAVQHAPVREMPIQRIFSPFWVWASAR